MAKNIPFKLILEKAKDYQADMTRFLRDMVAIPSESCDEKRVVHRIKEEMEKVGFDKVEIDPMGNVLGYISTAASGGNGRSYRYRRHWQHQKLGLRSVRRHGN